eukprot:4995116-Lingulodinium_polyedra.AAC.1
MAVVPRITTDATGRGTFLEHSLLAFGPWPLSSFPAARRTGSAKTATGTSVDAACVSLVQPTGRSLPW